MGKLLDKLRRVQAGGRPFCTMIVPAAGSSARMGGGDKLMMELEGVPVLVRTLRALDAAQLVDEIIIATREDRLLEVADLCRRCGLRKPVRVGARTGRSPCWPRRVRRTQKRSSSPCTTARVRSCCRRMWTR